MSLGNGVWLVLALVPWYVSAVAYSLYAPFQEHAPRLMSLFGLISIASAISGLVLAIKNRTPNLLWLFLPLGACFLFVFVSGFLRGRLPAPGMIQVSCTVAEAVLLGVFVWRMRPNWFTGVTLAVFCSTIWVTALFMSSMSFTDTWL
jgi:hypothetical protein